MEPRLTGLHPGDTDQAAERFSEVKIVEKSKGKEQEPS